MALRKKTKPRKSTQTRSQPSAGVARPTRLSPSEELGQVLRRAGPMLSNDLARRFEAKGITPEAARQRTSRLPQGVKALKGVTFPKRARFIYLESEAGTSKHYASLVRTIHERSPALSSALYSLDARGGVMSLRQFHISSGCPIRQKGQVSADRALLQLEAAGLVRRMELAGQPPLLISGGSGGASARISRYRAIALAESFLLDAIAKWLGSMNIASPKAVAVRSEAITPQFSTFAFDLCGPSYLAPLRQFEGGKLQPGFSVCDVFLGKELNKRDIAPFLRKCKQLDGVKGRRPYLPILIADAFEEDALHECRNAGVITTRPETLFGRDVAMALGSLIKTLTTASQATPEKLDLILRRLGAIEGAAGNLRGALFEMVTGHLLSEIEGATIEIGVIANEPDSGKRAEIDVLARRQLSVGSYECKGHQPNHLVSRSDAELWLESKVPVIYASNIITFGPNINQKFEYWTCGKFDDQALHFLTKAAANTKRYAISWKDGGAIKDYAKKLSASGVRKHLADHFFSHPLSDTIKHKPTKLLTRPLGQSPAR